jgi:stage IV sporulation protein FB
VLADTSTPFDWRFRLFGFPCTINGLFWVGALMLAPVSPAGRDGMLLLLVWVVALLLAILVHELGHAFVARAFGCHVTAVKVIMLGGFCAYDRHPRARWQRIAISLAGPGAGLLLWGLLEGLDRSVDLSLRAANVSPYLFYLISFSTMVNLFLSLLNLLPVLPMDGGRVCEELCDAARVPEPPITARWIGVAVAGLLTAYGVLLFLNAAPKAMIEMIPWWLSPSPLMTLWFALFAVQNYQEIQALRAARGWGTGPGNDESWR